WGEAIDVSIFYGRTEELATLAQWVLQDQCRLVALLGMGGIGKTALAVKLAEQVQGQFKYLIWRSLLHAPPVKEILTELIQFLSKQESALTETLNCGVSRLIDFLRKDRCLLVLDNAEAILRSSDCAGHYRDGYQGYSELLRRVGEVHHQSCLVLISQEKPQEIALLEGEKLPIRSLQLTGLKEAAVQEMLKVKGSFYGSKKEWSILIQHYTGNPLALKMVAAKIQQLFDGNISEFLTHLDQGMLIFDDIRDFLARQFNRLSNMEKEVMYWLAIEREFVSFAELRDDMLTSSLQRKLPEALISLGQRSLVEKNTMLFTLQPAVMEYVTSQLIEQVCQEVFTQKVALLKSHALLKVQARDYIQDSQIRLILKPVIERLLNTLACKNSVKKQLTQILSALQDQCPQDLGYAAENLLNLLYQLETCLSEHSFSKLNLRP
ncbi:MAG TPA: NB-ARC domain-containing protein, partial [Candidatus Caenarcaniphilales bacterium]